MVKSYTFNDKNEFSKKGVILTKKYLETLKETIAIVNVEDNPKYQEKDIDLIWHCMINKKAIEITIEVKTDSYTTGNFFLETLSNKSAGTLGCFLKTEAKYLFYYFTEWDKLYILPMKKTIVWFEENKHRFEEKETTTKDEKGNYVHTTVGLIVPIQTILDEVRNIKVVKMLSKKINN